MSKIPISCSVVIGSTSSAIAGVRERILSDLEAGHFSEEDIFAVHLALEEAFLNAFKHGNKRDPAKEIKVNYSVSVEEVEISMMDEGDGFDPDVVPDPRRGENLYKTAGRGLFLMRSYMDVVEYNERGNRVRMIRYKEKPRVARKQSRSVSGES